MVWSTRSYPNNVEVARYPDDFYFKNVILKIIVYIILDMSTNVSRFIDNSYVINRTE